MLDLYELRQLVAFAELGTLSKVADQFRVSTPLNMTFYLMRQTMVL